MAMFIENNGIKVSHCKYMMLVEENTPDRIRTCDRRIRNPELYPAELRALKWCTDGSGGLMRE